MERSHAKEMNWYLHRDGEYRSWPQLSGRIFRTKGFNDYTIQVFAMSYEIIVETTITKNTLQECSEYVLNNWPGKTFEWNTK